MILELFEEDVIATTSFWDGAYDYCIARSCVSQESLEFILPDNWRLP